LAVSAFLSQFFSYPKMVRPATIRVVLPQHLRTLANVGREVSLDLQGPITVRSILDALESVHPELRGAIRDQITQQRRPLVRFFACEEDVSHASMDSPLPGPIASGAEPFFIVGAIAGGC
jgi:sulfur-carrier protein